MGSSRAKSGRSHPAQHGPDAGEGLRVAGARVAGGPPGVARRPCRRAARPARAEALQHEMVSGWSVPVRAANKVLAVLEFYSRIRLLEDPEALAAVETAAASLGQMLARSQERGRAEELYRQQEILLDSVADGICGVDRHGKVSFANPAAARLLGAPASSLTGKPVHDLLHAAAPANLRCSEDCALRRAWPVKPRFPEKTPSSVSTEAPSPPTSRWPRTSAARLAIYPGAACRAPPSARRGGGPEQSRAPKTGGTLRSFGPRLGQVKKWPTKARRICGEGGIRTRGRLLTCARLASGYLRPLGHLSRERRGKLPSNRVRDKSGRSGPRPTA